MKIIAEFWDDNGLWASRLTEAGDFLPEAGTYLVLRSPEVGGPDARRVHVASVEPLSSFDGFLVLLRMPDFTADPLIEERKFRQELAALGWTIHAKAQRLPAGADDDDLDEDD